MTEEVLGEPSPAPAGTGPNPAPARSRPARFGPWRREARAFLELLALAGVALAQPTLDILSKNSSVFISRRTTPAQIIFFTLIVVLVPPLVAWSIEVATGLVFPPIRRYVHALLCAAAVGVVTVEILKKQTSLTPHRLVAVAIVAGIVAGIAIWRFEIVRLWLRYLALAPAVFAILFLFFSPVTSVVFRKGPAAANGVTVGKPTRVVMIVMDEFSLESLLDGTGKVDSTLYPHFAELAATSNWYRNATTVAPYTQLAVPAIVTGDKPESVPPAVASVYPDNLFTLLGGSYEMNVHESVTRLCPSRICPQTKQAAAKAHNGFRGLLDDGWVAWTEFASPETKTASIDFSVRQSPSDAKALAKGDEFLRSLVPADRARLDFLHVLLPHQPWHYIGTGQDNETVGRGVRGISFYSWYNEQTAAAGKLRYLVQVQAADRMVGEIIAKLKRLGVWDDSLVVLTADHGVAFTPQSSIRGVSNENYDQIMWVPLFVKQPNQTAGVVDDRPVESVDILPTIADVLDTELPWRTDGHSALRKPRPDGPRPLYDWKLNRLKPAPGTKYLEVDGPTGFQRMLKGRASTSTGDPALRLYQIGEYGDLVGREAAPLVDDSGGRPPEAVITKPESFDDVDPKARRIPWQYIEGTSDILRMAQPLAVVVNGKVAGIGTTWYRTFAPSSDFWASVAPALMKRGKNELRLYEIEGPADNPRLTPVQLAG